MREGSVLCDAFNLIYKLEGTAVVVEQLLPISEDPGSNLVIGKFYLQSTS